MPRDRVGFWVREETMFRSGSSLLLYVYHWRASSNGFAIAPVVYTIYSTTRQLLYNKKHDSSSLH